MVKLTFEIVDAFVDGQVVFSGNPAVVIVLPHDDAISDVTKQQIASQFNLSETVYVSPKWTKEECERNKGLSEEEWVIRWFTPTIEVALCGHATLAASHVLLQSVLKQSSLVKFQTNFDTRLQATRDGAFLVLDFPRNDPSVLSATTPWLTEIAQGLLGTENVDKVCDVHLSPTTAKLVVRLRDDVDNEFLKQVKPNIDQLVRVNTDKSVRGIILTKKTSVERDQAHFFSRYFAPWAGINEDPVTGSAHTVLTPYWHRVYQEEHGQQIEVLKARQVSRRVGVLQCQLTANRVLLKGLARVFYIMKLDFQIVDAFVNGPAPFTGNPAAVIVLPHDDAVDDVTKQQIAMEFNLSETVYVSPKWTKEESDKNQSLSKDEWVIRWFTPTCEVELCGHATLAASHVLLESVLSKNTAVIKYQTNFNTRLQATRANNLVSLDFPRNDPVEVNSSWVEEIKCALVGPENVGKVRQVLLSPTIGYLLVRLHDDASGFITEVKPNFAQLLRVDTNNSIRVGIILTQKTSIESDQAHFVSRFFAPWTAVNEDPVTGSAHTVSTPYWHRVYQVENGQQIETFHAKQLSRRGGVLQCQLTDTRVIIKGLAREFCNGTLDI